MSVVLKVPYEKFCTLAATRERRDTRKCRDFEKRRARAEDGDRAASDFVAVEGKENEVSAL